MENYTLRNEWCEVVGYLPDVIGLMESEYVLGAGRDQRMSIVDLGNCGCRCRASLCTTAGNDPKKENREPLALLHGCSLPEGVRICKAILVLDDGLAHASAAIHRTRRPVVSRLRAGRHSLWENEYTDETVRLLYPSWLMPQDNSIPAPDPSTPPDFTSTLEPGPQRFLAYVIEHGLAIRRRTAKDFIRHFPPSEIMEGLSACPTLRADILEPASGLRRKICIKKSFESAGDDLQIALDEGETNPEQIVSLFRPDDRVRYLDNVKLWTYVTEGEFWKTPKDGSQPYENAKDHIAFTLDRALIDGLLTHADLVAGVSVEELAQSLPRTQLAAIINAALELGRRKKVFSEAALLETAAARILVEDVSLVHIWKTVIVPKIAMVHGFEIPEPAPQLDAESLATLPKPLALVLPTGSKKASPVNSASASTKTPVPVAVKAQPTPVPVAMTQAAKPAEAAKSASALTSGPAVTSAEASWNIEDSAEVIEEIWVEEMLEEEEVSDQKPERRNASPTIPAK